ncbi:hypothetical protein L3X38_013290 [Prunus dulcis]|uniref:Vacuolar iron transporter n=1 Tax=Prunus dulcis TaxID=3755 RepID=A0AAD4ZHE9_PRUDU|nr:hypothetical protein L3X38_013290 [Prunus dulcis]
MADAAYMDVLVLGFANLVADGISMGFGDFMSSSSEKDIAAKERAVTEWDVADHSGPELVELLRRYQALGMDVNDATTVDLPLELKEMFEQILKSICSRGEKKLWDFESNGNVMLRDELMIRFHLPPFCQRIKNIVIQINR